MITAKNKKFGRHCRTWFVLSCLLQILFADNINEDVPVPVSHWLSGPGQKVITLSQVGR